MAMRPRIDRGIPLRTVAPNAVTALALCFGLTAVRFAISADWEIAVTMILIAAILDGIDGRVARMMRAESRFGAELDSLSDAISFGVAPALVLYLWVLQEIPRLGWLIALVYAVFAALRLARFNAQIDHDEQPHKSAGFLTGVPAPAGAALALLPIFLWISTGWDVFRERWFVAPWVAIVAVLMVSSLATFSSSSVRLRRGVRFEVLAGAAALAAAMLSAPWITLSALAFAYLVSIPFSVASYRRIRRQRGSQAVPARAGPGDAPATGPGDERLL